MKTLQIRIGMAYSLCSQNDSNSEVQIYTNKLLMERFWLILCHCIIECQIFVPSGAVMQLSQRAKSFRSAKRLFSSKFAFDVKFLHNDARNVLADELTRSLLYVESASINVSK